jgi:HEAT repeat protein
MHMRGTWLAAGAGLILGLGALAWLGRSHEPSYGGRPLSVRLGQLADADYQVRAEAAKALENLGPEAVRFLAGALRARDGVLNQAWRKLRVRFSPPMAPGPEAARIREQAAGLLARLGPAAASAAPALVEGLADPDLEVRRAVQAALGRLGPVAVPELVAGLRHYQPTVRRQAAELLGQRAQFGGAIDNALGPLAASLTDAAPGVRQAAAASLAAFPGLPNSVVDRLGQTAADPVPEVRLAAIVPLGGPGVEPAAARSVLGRLIKDPEPRVQVQAARALWRQTGETNEAVPVLVAQLRDYEVHWQAALALGDMGPAAAAAIPALLEALEQEAVHRPARTPASAAVALARMGPAAVPGLTIRLHHEKAWVRLGAATALAGHGPEARPALDGLLAMLADPDPEARMVAAAALAAMGSSARDALPRLAAMAETSDEYLRASAQNAMTRIQSGTPPRGGGAEDGIFTKQP